MQFRRRAIQRLLLPRHVGDFNLVKNILQIRGGVRHIYMHGYLSEAFLFEKFHFVCFFPSSCQTKTIDSACKREFYLDLVNPLELSIPLRPPPRQCQFVSISCKRGKSVRLKLAWWPPKTVVLKLDLVSPDGDNQTK